MCAVTAITRDPELWNYRDADAAAYRRCRADTVVEATSARHGSTIGPAEDSPLRGRAHGDGLEPPFLFVGSRRRPRAAARPLTGWVPYIRMAAGCRTACPESWILARVGVSRWGLVEVGGVGTASSEKLHKLRTASVGGLGGREGRRTSGANGVQKNSGGSFLRSELGHQPFWCPNSIWHHQKNS